MWRRLVFVIAASLTLTLTGCCLGSGCYIQPSISGLTSWDGLGPVPKPNGVKRAKVRNSSEAVSSDSPNEAELAALKPYSSEWWSVRDAIDRTAEIKLTKKLIICRDCMPPERDDQTGSIAPK